MSKNTVTITDNRTGQSYEIPVEDGAIRAMDLRQIKTSDDDFGLSITPPGGSFLGRHRVFGIGPEATLPIASKSKLYGFLNLRYFWETGARTTLEGNTFVATFTFPIPSIPLQ